jgi:hypothetical protein
VNVLPGLEVALDLLGAAAIEAEGREGVLVPEGHHDGPVDRQEVVAGSAVSF